MEGRQRLGWATGEGSAGKAKQSSQCSLIPSEASCLPSQWQWPVKGLSQVHCLSWVAPSLGLNDLFPWLLIFFTASLDSGFSASHFSGGVIGSGGSCPRLRAVVQSLAVLVDSLGGLLPSSSSQHRHLSESAFPFSSPEPRLHFLPHSPDTDYKIVDLAL